MTFERQQMTYEQFLTQTSTIRVSQINGMQDGAVIRLTERRVQMMTGQLERILSGELHVRFPQTSASVSNTRSA